MAVRPVQRTSLVEGAVAELRRLLAAEHWPVGARLPGEVELSRLLGVGRSTGREAVRALIASGQLRSQQGSGTYVVSTAPVEEFERGLRRAAVADVYEVRIALEVEAGRLAATRRTDKDVVLLGELLGERGAAGSDAELVEADLRLHRAVVTAAHNPVLAQVYDSFLGALRVAARDAVADGDVHDGPGGDDARAHEDLVAAVVAGDPQAAEEATRRNLGRALERLRGA
ncbi:FadR/GntR family transcriptional regulator [Streptomyces sp. NPDC001493]